MLFNTLHESCSEGVQDSSYLGGYFIQGRAIEVDTKGDNDGIAGSEIGAGLNWDFTAATAIFKVAHIFWTHVTQPGALHSHVVQYWQ